MLIYTDYRSCVKYSLQIMKEQRESLCRKSREYDVTIFSGLHERNEQIRSLYFQLSLIDWVDSHWLKLQEVLDNHSEFTTDQNKQITLFFAGYLSKFLDNVQATGTLSKLEIPNLLRMQKKILSDLMAAGEHWEENSAQLRLQMKRHEEQYARLIQQVEHEMKEE